MIPLHELDQAAALARSRLAKLPRSQRRGLRRVSSYARLLYVVSLMVADEDGQFRSGALTTAMNDHRLVEMAKQVATERRA